MELSEFDIVFKARTSIKGQALVYFVAEWANILEMDEVNESVEAPRGAICWWFF